MKSRRVSLARQLAGARKKRELCAGFGVAVWGERDHLEKT